MKVYEDTNLVMIPREWAVGTGEDGWHHLQGSVVVTAKTKARAVEALIAAGATFISGRELRVAYDSVPNVALWQAGIGTARDEDAVWFYRRAVKDTGIWRVHPGGRVEPAGVWRFSATDGLSVEAIETHNTVIPDPTGPTGDD